MILDKIFAYKKEELEHFKHRVPLQELKNRARDARSPISLGESLLNTRENFAIIAEIKRKSPSKGIIRKDFDPVAIARDYAQQGATAISILTDEHFFGGNLDHLKWIRKVVEIPLLRKDFIWDSYQIYAALDAGADAILLIAAMLEYHQMEDLQGLAEELGLSALVEVHNIEECKQATALGAKIIGVNNRDLQTFEVDIVTWEKLFPYLPPDAIKVSESGIDSKNILERLKSAGAQGYLIGELFMKEPLPGRALKELLAGTRK